MLSLNTNNTLQILTAPGRFYNNFSASVNQLTITSYYYLKSGIKIIYLVINNVLKIKAPLFCTLENKNYQSL